MGAALHTCRTSIGLDTHEYRTGDTQCIEPQSAGPPLVLKIVAASTDESMGTHSRNSAIGKEVIIEHIEKVKGFEPMMWRYERAAQQYAAGGPTSLQAKKKMKWPAGPRCAAPRRFFRVRAISIDGQGGMKDQWCMLQVAAEPSHRTMEVAEADMLDSKDAAAYADNFNKYLRTSGGERGSGMAADALPGVRVCAPAACTVLGGAAKDIAEQGQTVLLIPYSSREVRKFVFDGSEEFLEVPQAFFHHVAWSTSGALCICDLQGIEEDDGTVLLVDPCVIRTARTNTTSLLSALATGNTGDAGQVTAAASCFEVLHPRCSQTCKGFDPSRRGALTRRHCGLGISCGVGGG